MATTLAEFFEISPACLALSVLSFSVAEISSRVAESSSIEEKLRSTFLPTCYQAVYCSFLNLKHLCLFLQQFFEGFEQVC